MGRPRKLANQGLPVRVYLRSGAYYYVHRDGRWERLGRDLPAARKVADVYNSGASVYGSMAYWLDEWAKELKLQVTAGQLSERTRRDYVDEASPYLKDFFGGMAPTAIQAHHVANYLKIGRDSNRAVRANREKAALSSCMTWMVAHNKAGLKVNVCKAVARNTEIPRDRYIEDDEYIAVMKHCGPAEAAWGELIYRTLQRPSDILRWTHNNIIERDGKKQLRFRQGKSQHWMTIEVSETLQKCFDTLAAQRRKRSLYLIPREDGKPYTETGIASMFRRAVVAAGKKDFAPYDLKAKGATDLYQEGMSLEVICSLCGHESVKTTEIYIKRHLRVVVKPNDRIITPSKPAIN